MRKKLENNYLLQLIDFCQKNRVSTTEVADALDKSGVFPGVKPLNSNQYKLGPVRCIFTANNSNFTLHEQIKSVQQGDVIIIFTHNCDDRAVLGDLISKYVLLYKGAAAIVVEGLVRDISSIRREGYAIWSQGFTPLGCHNEVADLYPKEKELEVRDFYEGGLAICDDGGVTIIPNKKINEEMLARLNHIEMQEDIWFFCLDTLKWDTKKIVCDKAYLKETNLLSSVHLENLKKWDF